MKSMRVLLGVLMVATLLGGAVTVERVYAKGKATTLKGDLVDLSCYLEYGTKGAARLKCTAARINKGLPVGLLTTDNKLFLLIEDHTKPNAYAAVKKHAGKQVSVTGSLCSKSGMNGIAVESVK